MHAIISRIKFFYKARVVAPLRAFLLFVFGTAPNRREWEKRMLLVYLQSIGDVIVFTSILKHYRAAFPSVRIHLLLKGGLGIEKAIRPFVDEVITVDYRRFATDPVYGFRFLNRLRAIGFHTVINQDHSPVEIEGKMIALGVGAEITIAYEGIGISFRKPYDANMAKCVDFAVTKLYPRFTRVIPSIDKTSALRAQPFKSVVEHLIYFFERVTGSARSEYATRVPVDLEDERSALAMCAKDGIQPGRYAVVNLGSNAVWRNWPVERFAEAARAFGEKNIPVVLIGAPHQSYLGEEFKKIYHGKVLDLIGRATFSESIALISRSFIVLTNDTSVVHVAVALKKPSVCIVGRGYANLMAFYGYRDINVWVYDEHAACFADNFQCAKGLSPGETIPCIASIPAAAVSDALRRLITYLERTPDYPKESFAPSFLN